MHPAALAGSARVIDVHHLLLHVAEGVRGVDLDEVVLHVGHLVGLAVRPAEDDDAAILERPRVRHPRVHARDAEAGDVPEDGVRHVAVGGAEEVHAAWDHGEAGLLAGGPARALHRRVEPRGGAAEAQLRERREGLGQPLVVVRRRGQREVGAGRSGFSDLHDGRGAQRGRRRGRGGELVQLAPLEADAAVAGRRGVPEGAEVALVRQRVRARVILRELGAGDGVDAAALEGVVVADGVLLLVLRGVVDLVAHVLPRLLLRVPRPARRDVVAVGDPEHEARVPHLVGEPLGEGDVARTRRLEDVASLHVVAHHLQLVHREGRHGAAGAVAREVQPRAGLTAEPGELEVDLRGDLPPDVEEPLVHAAALAEGARGPALEADEVVLGRPHVVAPVVDGAPEGQHAAVLHVGPGGLEVVEGHTLNLAQVGEDGVGVAVVLDLDEADRARLHHEPSLLAGAGVAWDDGAAAREGDGGEHAGCVAAVGELGEHGEGLGGVRAVQGGGGHLSDDGARIDHLPGPLGAGAPGDQGGPAQAERDAESQQEQPPRGAQRLELARGGFLRVVALLVVLRPAVVHGQAGGLLVALPRPDGLALEGSKLPARRLAPGEVLQLPPPAGCLHQRMEAAPGGDPASLPGRPLAARKAPPRIKSAGRPFPGRGSSA
mmetsp:Transcript_108861/g.234485  ORF Transcript_108861/g.234485 Transcript_108861/m.234485 type:complete len:660 (-) Transcript_108861:2-1981(-)